MNILLLEGGHCHSCIDVVCQIFKKPTIERLDLGAINCHAGKLPFYRGRNILNWALINDEEEFGITVHYVAEVFTSEDEVNDALLALIKVARASTAAQN